MSADPGPEFDVEPAPEKMEVDKKEKKKRRRSLLSRANQPRLAKKKERKEKEGTGSKEARKEN